MKTYQTSEKNIGQFAALRGLETVLYYFKQSCFRHISITYTQSLNGSIFPLERWAHGECTLSEQWVQVEQIGEHIWTIRERRAQTQGKKAQSERWTHGERYVNSMWTRDDRFIRSASGVIVTLCFDDNQEIIAINYMYVLLHVSAKIKYNLIQA